MKSALVIAGCLSLANVFLTQPCMAQIRTSPIAKSNAGSLGRLPKLSFSPIKFEKKIGNATLAIQKRTQDYQAKIATNKTIKSDNEEGNLETDKTICRMEVKQYTSENLDQDVLQPEAIGNLTLGGVYDLKDLQKASYRSIYGQRNPMVISMDDTPNQENVTTPGDNSLSAALQKLRTKPFPVTPAGHGTYLSSTQVTNTSTLNVAASLSYSGYGIKASDIFQYNKNSTTNKFLITYKRIAYTAYAKPADGQGGKLFQNDSINTNPDLVYIDKISYGAKLLVFFEANITEEDVKNGFKAQGYGINATLDLEVANRLSNTKFQVYLYGDNAPLSIPVTGYDAMVTKVNELLSKISGIGKKNPIELGQPLSYSLKFLDGDIAVTSCKVEDIPQKICGPNPNYPLDFKATLDGYNIEGGNIFGWVDVEILNAKGDRKYRGDTGYIETVFIKNRDAAIYQNISPNNRSPLTEKIYKNISQADRETGTVRIWYRIQNRKIGGTDVFLTKIDNADFDCCFNGLHGNYKGQFIDFPLKDFLANQFGQAVSKTITIRNGDKVFSPTFSFKFLY